MENYSKTSKILFFSKVQKLDQGVLDMLHSIFVKNIFVKTDYENVQSIVADVQPEIVLMEIDWGTPSSLNSLRSLRNLKEFEWIPVIVIGETGGEERLNEAYLAGATDFVIKPINMVALKARVLAALRLSKTQKMLKEKELVLQEKTAELAAKDAEKDHLMSIVAHDLKSPLSRIKGFAQLISMVGTLNDEQKQYIDMIHDVIKSGNNFIRDILDINSYEHHGSKMQIDKTELNELLAGLVESYKSQAAKKGISLHLSVNSEKLYLQTDKGYLSRILENLLSNAIKFSEEGKKVNLGFTVEPNHVSIYVEDEGPGISEADQAKMFRKFQKLSAQPTAGESSSGLGLSIIKTLTEKLNAEILVSSKLRVGTKFSIKLPLNYT